MRAIMRAVWESTDDGLEGRLAPKTGRSLPDQGALSDRPPHRDHTVLSGAPTCRCRSRPAEDPRASHIAVLDCRRTRGLCALTGRSGGTPPPSPRIEEARGGVSLPQAETRTSHAASASI